jgi:hypothetical protein
VSGEVPRAPGRRGQPPRPIPFGPLLALAAALGTVSAYLAGRAALDPPVPDASEVVTDTDATMWIPPDDAGPGDAPDGASDGRRARD